MKQNKSFGKPSMSDREVCQALIALIRSGKVIPLQDPNDPLVMRFASTDMPIDRQLKRLSVEEACRRLQVVNN